jgi:hypothetical protein
VGYAGRLDHSYAFQFNWLDIQMIEQSDTLSEQEGRDINVDFVHQARIEALLQDTGSTYDDILVACGLPGLTNGAFNPIGDKGEG